MSDRDYVLGTHDEEIERLGLQHRVWRPRMLDAWRRAGLTVGQTVLDVGAGPGYASADLAEIVGPAGRVVAAERSRRFIEALNARAKRHGLANIEVIEADVVERTLGDAFADMVWCRWLLSFALDPARVVARIAASLKPGGVAVFHEYLDYGAWRLIPPSEAFERFVDQVMESWRAAGGEPDVGVRLPGDLVHAGLEVVAVRPLIEVVRPSDFTWQWPASFVEVNLTRLVDLGRVTSDDAAAVRLAFAEASRLTETWMVTPCVLEVIARRPTSAE